MKLVFNANPLSDSPVFRKHTRNSQASKHGPTDRAAHQQHANHQSKNRKQQIRLTVNGREAHEQHH